MINKKVKKVHVLAVIFFGTLGVFYFLFIPIKREYLLRNLGSVPDWKTNSLGQESEVSVKYISLEDRNNLADLINVSETYYGNHQISKEVLAISSPSNDLKIVFSEFESSIIVTGYYGNKGTFIVFTKSSQNLRTWIEDELHYRGRDQ